MLAEKALSWAKLQKQYQAAVDWNPRFLKRNDAKPVGNRKIDRRRGLKIENIEQCPEQIEFCQRKIKARHERL